MSLKSMVRKKTARGDMRSREKKSEKEKWGQKNETKRRERRRED